MFEIFSKSFCHYWFSQRIIYPPAFLLSWSITALQPRNDPQFSVGDHFGVGINSEAVQSSWKLIFYIFSLPRGFSCVFRVRFCVTQHCHVKKLLISGSFANWTVLHEFLWKTQWQMYWFAADMVPGKWTPTRGPTIKGSPYIALQICVNHLSEYFAHEKLCQPESWGGSLPFISQILDLIF